MTNSSRASAFSAFVLLLLPFALAAPVRYRPTFDIAATPPPFAAQGPIVGAGILAQRQQREEPTPPGLDFFVEPDMGYFEKRDLVERNNTLSLAELEVLESLLKTPTCLNSTATDVTINLLLYFGGPGTIVQLCPGATIYLNTSIFFTNAFQELITEGLPTDDTRATLVVTGATQSNAIYGACDHCQNIAVRNIQVNGQRDVLGYLAAGIALLEMGGSTNGQIVDNCHIYEPRGWTALHAVEGTDLSCSNITITSNQIGPCGNAPTTGLQFRGKRDATYAPGEWSDGISLACKQSVVDSNVITDATDGGIVIFQAPGSLVTRNTIISINRVLLGGINAVDYFPFGGGFTDTVVEGNLIRAESTMIKVGMGLGTMTWGIDNRTASRTYGGLFRNNLFESGVTGYFGYAMSVAGHENATVLGNVASNAKFGGAPSSSCISNVVPSSQAFVFDKWTSPDYTLQNNFVQEEIAFLICQQPGLIIGTGTVTALGTSILSGIAHGVEISPLSPLIPDLVGLAPTVLAPVRNPKAPIRNPKHTPRLPTVISATAIATKSPPVVTSHAVAPTPTAVPTPFRPTAIASRRGSGRSRASVAAQASMSAASLASSLAAEARATPLQLVPSLPVPNDRHLPYLPVLNPKHLASQERLAAAKLLASRVLDSRTLKRGTATLASTYSRVTPVTPAGMVNPYTPSA